MSKSERLTVGFAAKESSELTELASQTGLSKSSVLSRAVSLYAFVEAEAREGRELIMRDPKSGEQRVVKFL